jgi:hypothetical protein
MKKAQKLLKELVDLNQQKQEILDTVPDLARIEDAIDEVKAELKEVALGYVNRQPIEIDGATLIYKMSAKRVNALEAGNLLTDYLRLWDFIKSRAAQDGYEVAMPKRYSEDDLFIQGREYISTALD